MNNSLYDYCVEQKREELLKQWHPLKNGTTSPETVTFGSHQKIWWRCDAGHEWQAAVYSRAKGNNGCPYCSNVRAWPGTNDLASHNPALAAQWHPTKNEEATPAFVSQGSNKKVWWLCEKGHEWQASIKSRNQGSGCPICKKKTLLVGENDFAATHPTLSHQWHPTKNGTLAPNQVVAGTRRKVWWLCEKGHEWQASVLSRTSSGRDCPVCAGKMILAGINDLATLSPDIAAQWHPRKNNILTPKKVSLYSNKKVWWVCDLGHEYTAQVGARTQGGAGCPYCAGRKVLPGFNDLATLKPEVAAQWHPSLNGTLTPEMVTIGSHKKVWWICPNEHVWKAVIYSRASRGMQNCGCPVCAGRVKEKQTSI